MPTIEKRGKNSYRIGLQVETATGWEWVRETIHVPADLSEAKQRKEVEKAVARLSAEVYTGRTKPAQRGYTVRTFSEKWMQEHVKPNLSENTYKNYAHLLGARILPMIGDVQLKKLTPLVVTEWLNAVRVSPRMSTKKSDDEQKRKLYPNEKAARDAQAAKPAKPLSANTVSHYYICLQAMLDKAVQWDILTKNPMDKVTPPKVPKVKVNYLTEARAVELLRCLKDEPNMCYRAALLLALLCGLRLGEVGALRLTDVDWDNGTIDITHALKYTPQAGSFEGAPKSDAGQRLIALPPGMMAVLHETREYQKDVAEWAHDVWVGDGLIVHAWNGAQLHHDTPSKWFRRFADAHGFQGIRFHDLRHTHATILLANNIDAVAVASRLGHADATVTLRTYAHALRRRDTDAANAAQHIFDLATTPER